MIAHIEKLKYIIFKFSPQIICIQETNFKDNYNLPIKGYQCFYKNRINRERASGGVSIYVKNEFVTKEISITSNFEIIGVSIQYYQYKISVANIYLPPNEEVTTENLNRLILQIPSPRIILGDFNANNIIWGSKTIDKRGRCIEEFIDNNNLVLLNTGEGTRYNVNTGEFSTIDLTLCDAQIASDLTWNPHPYLYSSDHLPISIDHNRIHRPNINTTTEKWNLNSADWIGFSTFIDNNLPEIDLDTDVNIIIEELSTLMKNAAERHIKKFTPPTNHIPVPWWNAECNNAIKASKRAFNKLKRQYTPENNIMFKKLRARTRYILKKSKRESWAQYISTINSTTPPSEIWNKIRNIKGSNSTHRVTSLVQDDKVITSNLDIAEIFADEYANSSSDDNYSKTFLQYKNTTETRYIPSHSELMKIIP